MDGEKDLKGFLERAERIGKTILELKNPLIVHDYDVDGITAGAIVALALKEKEIPFETRAIARRDEKTVEEIAALGKKELVLCDWGSGMLSKIEELVPNAVIIDHHQMEMKPKKTLVANPCEFGFDGSSDACSASTAFYCFKELDRGKLSELAVVGAVGDIQDNYGPEGGFAELNKVALDSAVEKGSVLAKKDLRIWGRVSRPLIWFLSYSTEPFLPGLTGNEKACAAFLVKNNIPVKEGEKWVHYYDLNVFQRRRLASALINYCFEKGLDTGVVKELVGDVFLLLKEPKNTELYDAHEYSTLLNACGRLGKAGTGLRVCLGDQQATEEARTLLRQHRADISKGIFFAKRNASDVGAFYLLDAKRKIKPTIVGSIIGTYFNSGLVQRTKPIIGLSVDESGAVKASARASKTLVRTGLNLGMVMKEAAAAAGGIGGGHSIAAGASFPSKNEKTFLTVCKKLVQEQLKPRPNPAK
jgi:RecJ-like exonuclease